MIKKPALLFSILILIAITVIVIYRYQTDPFNNMKSDTHTTQSQNNPPSRVSESIVQLYMQNCATCHGVSGQGMSGYPSLQQTRLSVDAIKERIQTGAGAMPAFPQIQEPQLTKLAEMVKQFSAQ
jgi:cytochrome c553